MSMKSTILVIALLLYLLIPVMQITAATEGKQPVYKPGDYFIYKADMTYSNETFKCTAELTAKIVITKIEWPYVTYNITYTNVNTNCPPEQVYIPPVNATFTLSNRIDKPPSSEAVGYFVDPSYSEEFKYTTEYVTISANYKNGVLISATIKLKSPGEEMIGNINLVETSVPGLITPRYLILIIIGVIIAVGVVVTIILIKSAKKPLQPTLPPPLPPTAAAIS